LIAASDANGWVNQSRNRRAQCAIALQIGNYAIEVRRGETLLQTQQTGPTTFRVLAVPR
jgi:hypothetical protein